MATVYDVKMEIVSERVSFSSEDMKKIIQELIKSFKYKDTGFTIYTHDLEVKMKA
jgi:hypothetical protein